MLRAETPSQNDGMGINVDGVPIGSYLWEAFTLPHNNNGLIVDYIYDET